LGKEINLAIFELNNLHDFLMEISELTNEEMVKEVEEKYPEFIEHIEAMENPSSRAIDFWSGFGIWSTTRLSSKYKHIWKEVIKFYYKSNVHQESQKKWALRGKVDSQIEDILKDSSL
jgi:hypothetical protein